MKRQKGKIRGFTVVELITAIAIVAVIVTMLSAIFSLGIKANRQADEIIGITNKAQRFLGQMSRELAGAMIQSAGPRIPIVGKNTEIYFMAPWENSSSIELCELGYKYDAANNEIDRFFKTSGAGSYEYPGDVTIDDGAGQMYVDGVSSLTFQYYNGSSWSTNWNGGNPDDTQLPNIVEIEAGWDDSRGVTYTFTTRVFLAQS